MLKNFWYAIEFSEEITPQHRNGLTILGQELVLYRDTTGKTCRHE